MEEIWKDIPGFEGMYQVSNLSRVRSLPRLDKRGHKIKGKLLKQMDHSCGYKVVSLRGGGNYHMRYIHRLVAEAFIPNPENKPCIDHINGIRNDNRIENLRWCTVKENNSFELAIQHHVESHPSEKNPNYGKFGSLHHLSKTVYQYTDNFELVATYGSCREGERMTGFPSGCISRACSNRLRYKGFLWSYEPLKKAS